MLLALEAQGADYQTISARSADRGDSAGLGISPPECRGQAAFPNTRTNQTTDAWS